MYRVLTENHTLITFLKLYVLNHKASFCKPFQVLHDLDRFLPKHMAKEFLACAVDSERNNCVG